MVGADFGEQAGALGHLEGWAVYVSEAEGDVAGVQGVGQLAELFSAGDVKVVVGVQDEHYGVDRSGGGGDGLLDAIAD